MTTIRLSQLKILIKYVCNSNRCSYSRPKVHLKLTTTIRDNWSFFKPKKNPKLFDKALLTEILIQVLNYFTILIIYFFFLLYF